MTSSFTSLIRHCGIVAVLAGALGASAFGSANAQQTTPLRMGNQNTQRCLTNCGQRTQSCYAKAKTPAGKEACENNGITCKSNCR